MRRKDYHLLTVGNQAYSTDSRIAVKVAPDGSDWVLNIRWVEPHDAGEYECQVSSYPPRSLIVLLTVIRKFLYLFYLYYYHISIDIELNDLK